MDAATEPSPRRADRRPAVGAVGRAAGRPCSRPGCATPAAVTLLFSYHEQLARLVALLEERDPQAYDLCDPHAARTAPPRDWDLVDERPVRHGEPQSPLDDEDGTVAILAAALHGEGAGAGRVRPVAVPDEPVAAPPMPVDASDRPAPVADAAPRAVPAPVPTTARPSPPPLGVDPLRAALEELQRLAVEDPAARADVAAPDVADADVDATDSAPGTTPAPRRRRVLVVDVDDPDAEPTLW